MMRWDLQRQCDEIYSIFEARLRGTEMFFRLPVGPSANGRSRLREITASIPMRIRHFGTNLHILVFHRAGTWNELSAS